MRNSVIEAVFRQDVDGTWLVEVPSLPGCHTFGETLDEARTHAQDVVRLWVASDDITLHEVVEAAPAP